MCESNVIFYKESTSRMLIIFRVHKNYALTISHTGVFLEKLTVVQILVVEKLPPSYGNWSLQWDLSTQSTL
jgi:hypothetical protein